MRSAFSLILFLACTGTLHAQHATDDHVAATADVRDAVPVTSFVTIEAPTDSVDRDDPGLLRYPLSDAASTAEAYRLEGMKWFHAGHTVEKYYPLLDSTLVPIRHYDFGAHRNPVLTSQAALAFYNAYLETGSDEYLDVFTKNVDWLVENHDEFYLRYDFEWSHRGRYLPEGWVSAMAQGEALAAVSRAYFLTGEQKYRDAAEGFFQTLHRNQVETWTFHVDTDGHYWLEEYPNRDLCRVLNGLLFGLWGLWDYHVITGDDFALTLFEAGLRSVADRHEIWNVPNQNRSRYCLHGYANETYHEIHLQQLDAYYRQFEIPELAEAAASFSRYHNVRISDTELDFGIVEAGVDTVRTLTIYNDGTALLEIDAIETETDAFRARAWRGTLSPGEAGNVDVAFASTIAGSHSDVLVISSNAGGIVVDLRAEVSGSAIGVGSEANDPLPTALALEQNFPNPFRTATSIPFSLPHGSHVRMEVFNVLGQSVAIVLDRPMPPGRHVADVHLTTLPNGIYFYRIETQAGTRTAQMILIGP